MMPKKSMFKLITCIAPEDKAQEALKKLEEDFSIQAMVDHFARGFGRSSTSPTKGLGQQTEKTTFTVLVKTSQVDEIFDYIYHVADLHRPHGGIIYVTAVTKSLSSPNIDATHLEQNIET